MGKPPTTPQVLEFLQNNKNIAVTVTQICEETGLDKGQVQAAIGNFKRRNDTVGKSIEVVVQGNVWIYRPHDKSTNNVFEYITTTKSGAFIIQDENGKIYKAVEID